MSRDFPRPRTPTQIRGGDGPPRGGGARGRRHRNRGEGRPARDAMVGDDRSMRRGEQRRHRTHPPRARRRRPRPPSPNPSANAPSSANYSPRAGSAIFPTVSTRAIATRRVAMETYGDVYAALHRHVVDVAPSALTNVRRRAGRVADPSGVRRAVARAHERHRRALEEDRGRGSFVARARGGAARARGVVEPVVGG